MPLEIGHLSDLQFMIPMNARRILEIGCGDGTLGASIKARIPNSFYVGLEEDQGLALVAKTRLDKVLDKSIEHDEQFEALLKLADQDPFDVIVIGVSTEFLFSQSGLLSRLIKLVCAKGVCVGYLKDIRNWEILKQKVAENSDIEHLALMDQAELERSAQETVLQSFTGAGWTVLESKPLIVSKIQATEAANLAELHNQGKSSSSEGVVHNASALGWVVSASNGAPETPIYIAALAIQKVAGVNEARVDYPLTALKSLPNVKAVWGQGSLTIPKDFKPGVLILHRQFLNSLAVARHIERLIDAGWVIVSEIDDDPGHWRGYVDSNFIAFRGVHAVSVSTQRLAARMRSLNPNTKVFENAIFELPKISKKPTMKEGRLRIFFGALNRMADWSEIKAGLVPALSELRNEIEFIVVHDKDIYNDLPEFVRKEFHPTLPPADYLEVLSSCDLSLLPLRDTPFNHLKSDLKLIESCACGVVPIFSEVVYADTPNAANLGVMMRQRENWGDALIELVRNPQRIADFRNSGLTYVTTQRMHSHSLGHRLEWLQGLIANKGRLEEERRERLRSMGLSSLEVHESKG